MLVQIINNKNAQHAPKTNGMISLSKKSTKLFTCS